MKKRDVLNSPRLLGLKKQRQRVVLLKIFLSLIAIALVFGGLVYISRISGLNISSIEINGNKFVESEAIKAIVEKKKKKNKGKIKVRIPPADFSLVD